jgi:oligopeptide/dipeptide ABC transporter ATP-binding protein
MIEERVEYNITVESRWIFLYLWGMTNPLLEARNLNVRYRSLRDARHILHGIDVSVEQGEILAIVGESGSGKTTLAVALTNLFLPFSGYEISGEVMFDRHNLLQADEQTMRQIRGHSIRYVFQEPAQSLNPIARIKTQYIDAIKSITPMHTRDAVEKATIDLKNVGIEHAEDVLNAFPHELSVGTLQRVLIALALSPQPKLIIADEPTSSVDAPMRFQLLDLLDAARKKNNTSIILITHDLEIAERYGETIAVMYAGRIVEVAPKRLFFESPLHPYSRMLYQGSRLTASLSADTIVHSDTTGLFLEEPTGCAFHPLCYKRADDCTTTEPILASIDSERKVRCPYWR